MCALRRIIPVWALLALESCVMLPYPTSAVLSVRTSPTPWPESTLVSIGPRAEILEANKRLLKRSERFQSVPSLEVRDAAFPDGGWRLEQLLDTASVARLAPLELDVLVLLEPLREETLRSRSDLSLDRGLGFSGTETGLERVTYAAWLFDPRRGCLLERVEASSSANSYNFGLRFVLFAVWPMVERSATNAFFDELADRMERFATGQHVRFGVLALENLPVRRLYERDPLAPFRH